MIILTGLAFLVLLRLAEINDSLGVRHGRRGPIHNDAYKGGAFYKPTTAVGGVSRD